ncbi:MAG: DUF433 domain-containing protein [Gemmataceae bacterium]|nr:DUF433 domain-containing protein [Gemmataceae bacterium]
MTTATDADEPLIRKTPDVIGGEACIRTSRIAVFMLVEQKQRGSTDRDFLRNYPTLTQRDLDAAWAYYAAHPDEIEEAIRRNNSDDDE